MGKKATAKKLPVKKAAPVKKVSAPVKKAAPVIKTLADFDNYDNANAAIEEMVNQEKKQLYLYQWLNHDSKFSISENIIEDANARLLKNVSPKMKSKSAFHLNNFDESFTAFETLINQGEQNVYLYEWLNASSKFTISQKPIVDTNARLLYCMAEGQKVGYNERLQRWGG